MAVGNIPANEERLNSDKKELCIGLDSFDEPKTLSNKKAWIQLIINLMYMIKGSNPSNPNMGVGIQEYDFQFLEEAIAKLEAELTDQIRTYLPDVPVNSITVDSTDSDTGKKILLIIIQLYYNGEMDSAVVAAEASQNIIDFVVSM